MLIENIPLSLQQSKATFDAKTYMREYVAANRDAINKRHRSYNEKHREKVKRHRQANPERAREIDVRSKMKNASKIKVTKRKYHLKSKYDLTPEQFESMFAEQGNCCAICKTSVGKWHVDHCHNTKKIRGILCHHCNTAIGLLKEDVVILENAIEYIKQYERLTNGT